MCEELWRWVVGYEGRYKVSNLGNIVSPKKKTRTSEVRLSTRESSRGYLYVHLRKDGNEQQVAVHRIVAMAFVDNPENKPQVNHIDGDKRNNKAENLEWVTPSENITHSIRTLGNPKPPRPKVSPNRHLTFEQAQAIRKDKRTQREIADSYGVSQGSVSLIKRGITYTKEDK